MFTYNENFELELQYQREYLEFKQIEKEQERLDAIEYEEAMAGSPKDPDPTDEELEQMFQAHLYSERCKWEERRKNENEGQSGSCDCPIDHNNKLY